MYWLFKYLKYSGVNISYETYRKNFKTYKILFSYPAVHVTNIIYPKPTCSIQRKVLPKIMLSLMSVLKP